MRRLALVLPLLAVFACGQDHSSAELTLAPTDTNVVGSFSLTAANGSPLPIVAAFTSAEEWDLIADQFVIAVDGTWIETSSYTVTTLSNGAQASRQTQSTGTYTIANQKINFVMSGSASGPFTGSVTGNVLSLLFNGGHFLYSR